MNEKLSLEKRETSKLRELMQTRAPTPSKTPTPMKKDSSSEKELNMLRDELTKKSELIKTLAAKVTTPKRNTSNSDGEEQPCCTALKTEIENLKEKHSKELEKPVEFLKCTTFNASSTSKVEITALENFIWVFPSSFKHRNNQRVLTCC